MRIDLHVWLHDDPTSQLILTKLGTLMATQAELAASLAALSTQVSKIATESTTTLAKLAELEAAIAAGGETTPEVDAAMEGLRTQLQLVDELVTDAPTP